MKIIRIDGFSDGAGRLNGTVLDDSGLGYGASDTWVGVGGGIETIAVYCYRIVLCLVTALWFIELFNDFGSEI